MFLGFEPAVALERSGQYFSREINVFTRDLAEDAAPENLASITVCKSFSKGKVT